MKLALAAFTHVGGQLSDRLAAQLEQAGHTITRRAMFGGAAQGEARPENLADWTARAFAADDGLVFVGACGIAVRAVAPCLKDKLTDPAVVSIDQQGRFAVPLVSGHVGGANALAAELAALTGGRAVISTATDLTGCFAVDVWAAKHRLVIGERTLAKEVSAALLSGKQIGFTSEFPTTGMPPEGLCERAELGICVTLNPNKTPFPKTLRLLPRWLILGAGCRRGVANEVFEREVLALLERLKLSVRSIGRVASIDRKKDELCLLAFCAKYQIMFETAAPEELERQQGVFTGSAFVRQVTGVDNVCERAAVWAGANRLLCGKQAANGVTLAVGMEEKSLTWCCEKE